MWYAGSNILRCRGKLIFGPNPRYLLFSMAIINVPVLLFSSFAFEFYWDRSLAWEIALVSLWVLLLLTDFFMVHTASREPGIVPARSWSGIKGYLPEKYMR